MTLVSVCIEQAVLLLVGYNSHNSASVVKSTDQKYISMLLKSISV